MNRKLIKILTLLIAIAIITGACGLPTAVQTISKTAEAVADAAQLPSLTSVEPIVNPSTDSPTKITGDFAYSNDFVLETYYVEQAVALADMHGFVTRDKEWITPTESQTLGFMGVDAENNNGTYTINLPILPEGTFNDVDNNGNTDQGVQIFASSYWPNLAGGPYSEGDDPTTGWPNYLASIKTDSENNDEVTAGKLFVWSPDSNQQFPTGFGDDAALFTNDDPVGPIPAGWSMVDLDSNPFSIVRDETLTAELY